MKETYMLSNEMTNDTIYIIAGLVVLALVGLIGTIVTLRRRARVRRVNQEVSAQLDREFGISDDSQFRSLSGEDDTQTVSPDEVWNDGDSRPSSTT